MKRLRWCRSGWLALSGLLLSSLVGVLIYLWQYNRAMDELATEHVSLITAVNTVFSQEVGDITNIIRLANEHITDVLDERDTLSDQIAIFQRVGSALNNVSQVRWIDTQGIEKVRINFSPQGSDVVAVNDLQDKSSRDYFEQASKTQSGEISLSAIDLNRENGTLTIPLQPTLRVSLHTFPRHPLGEGFLVINVDLTSLFEELQNFEPTQTQLMISEGASEWMLHPDPDETWTKSKGGVTGPQVLMQNPLFKSLTEQKVLSMEVSPDGAVISGTVMRLRMRHIHKSGEIYILAQTLPEFYQLLVLDAVIPSVAVAVGMFIVLWLVIKRDSRQQYRVLALSRQLLREKTNLKAALKQQTLFRDELVESEKMASLGMMVAGVAHELSTPVGGTTMCISTLENKLELLERKIVEGLTRTELDNYLAVTRESLTLSRRNLERITELIKRFKRLAVDRGNEDPVEFSLNQVVSDLISTLKSQTQTRHIALTFTISEPITLFSFPGLYSQILQNLVTNAMTHAFNEAESGAVSVTAINKGDGVEIRVKDNGCGIPESVQKTLFDPFVTTARYKGNTGLGMHLVHQWVTKILRGRIYVNTRQDEGTEFTVVLPALPPNALQTQSDDESSP